MARLPGHEIVYDVADLFRERCLIEGRSLLWPDSEVWTAENLQRFWDAFVGHTDTSTQNFFEKFQKQLANESVAIHQIATDVMVLYCLFPRPSNIGLATKIDFVDKIRGWNIPEDPDPDTWGKAIEAFKLGIASTGIFYSTGRFSVIAYFLKFCQLFLDGERHFTLPGVVAMADQARKLVKDDPLIKKDVTYGRNAVLHLLFPDEIESIASPKQKQMIVDAFAEKFGIDPAMDQDQVLLQIRRHFQEEVGSGHFNFYDPEIMKLWDPPKPVVVVKPILKLGGEEQPAKRPGKTVPPTGIAQLSAITYLPDAFLREINDLLCFKQQLIFEGPPGSGKTFVAEQFAEWFAGDARRVETIQFHQSYGYEDFVQGIRPETSAAGTLTYRVRDGIFKRLCDRAAKDLTNRYVLIIDEINRGNISRIFGELLLLLEYRNKTVTLPYGGSEEGRSATLTIPANFYIIGTMNTADRSLSQIDYALRRRFYFVRFMPVEQGRAVVLDGWLMQHAPDMHELILDLFISLNHMIERKLSFDFQIGHSYFMQDWIGQPGGLARIWKYAVRPLIDEYFHHHKDHAHILEEFSELFAPLLQPLPDVEDTQPADLDETATE